MTNPVPDSVKSIRPDKPAKAINVKPVSAPTRIKICGITSPEDALAAVSAGADAIGLVFYEPSARAVTIEKAAAIAAVVPPFVSVVALTVDEPAERVARILEQVSIDIIQFHGSESPQFCAQFGRPWLKALAMKPDVDLSELAARYASARGLLLDNWKEGVPGGTGEVFDWSLAPQNLPRPWVLAGGLNAGNVAQAVTALNPWAVDVSGGVEREPGVKDAEKIVEFVAAVRGAEAAQNGI